MVVVVKVEIRPLLQPGVEVVQGFWGLAAQVLGQLVQRGRTGALLAVRVLALSIVVAQVGPVARAQLQVEGRGVLEIFLLQVAVAGAPGVGKQVAPHTGVATRAVVLDMCLLPLLVLAGRLILQGLLVSAAVLTLDRSS